VSSFFRSASRPSIACTTGAFAFGSSTAFAHTPGTTAAISAFDVSALVLVGVLGIAYARGSWLLSRRTPARAERYRRSAFFWTGWASLAIALGPPLDTWTSGSFAAHMIQHELMMLLAAPLLVLARPLGVLLWGLPNEAADVVRSIVQAPVMRWLARLACTPIVAWLAHALILWGWHVPIAFEAALARDSVHWLQHTSFFVAAAIFWWSVFAAGPLAERRGAAIVSVFTTAVHTGALGALLTFSTRLWYPTYAPGSPAWGLTAIEDQQLGGLVMWVPGGTVFLIAGLALTAMWLKDVEKRVSAL
jgi:cytochrome c oxidase assembly factor CtaG